MSASDVAGRTPAHRREKAPADAQALEDFALLQKIVRAVRNLRAEYKLDPGQRLPARMASVRRPALLAANRDLLCALARLDAAAFARAVDASVDRLLRGRLGLPAVRFEE